jgi:SAM-dependent methyltransferase
LPARSKSAVLADLTRLYHEVWAYDIPASDVQRIDATAGSDVYGEIRPAAAAKLFDYLDLRADDVFFDLGSGAGKVVVHAALGTDVGLAVGVEMSKARHQLARSVLRSARAQGLDVSACRLRNADLMRTSLDGATVIYSCNTAFSDAFLTRLANRVARLSPGVRFLSTAELEPDPRLEHIDLLRLDMTWKRRARMHVYRVVPQAPVH